MAIAARIQPQRTRLEGCFACRTFGMASSAESLESIQGWPPPLSEPGKAALAANPGETGRLESQAMPDSERYAMANDFNLDDWVVQPALNRISRGGDVVQLEPKLMDVLTFLVDRSGQVVSKDELIDGVWKVEFISEWVITRAITKLRKALGDDAHQPRFIETISKRGYRLIAPVRPTSEPRPPGAAGRVAAHGTVESTVPDTPFAAGQWVRGDRFYGREAEIAEILDGNRDALWVLGTRAIGKTSLLRQVELVAAENPKRGYVPLFWDLQGAEDDDGLHGHLVEAIVDSRERFVRLGIDPDELDGGELFTTLGRLRRALVARGLRLLLLCDEAEELIQLQKAGPALIRKLRRALQSHEGIRAVLAASSRLWALTRQGEDTSPFLHGFTPPLYLGPLTDDAACSLLHQRHLEPGKLSGFTDELVEAIATRCGNHPYLLQLLGSRYLDSSDIEVAVNEVSSDRTVDLLISVDLGLLSDDERAVLSTLASAAGGSAAGTPADLDPSTTTSVLHRLERLGLVRRTSADQLVVSNMFLRQWLLRHEHQ